MDLARIPHFRFWCQKVLPLVYDDSLSYYEVLCKCCKYINCLITDNNGLIAQVDELNKEMAEVQKWIDNYDDSFAEAIVREWLEKNLASMVFFGLTDDGYFCAYIPDNWNHIDFATTGFDICECPCEEYGRIVLLY